MRKTGRQADNRMCCHDILRRMSVIWSSPLSDENRVTASNQFALPVLSYLMWTQTWPLAELRSVYRIARKIIVQNGRKHPLSSTALLYLQREQGGRGLQSVEEVYKATKVKAALKLYSNEDPTMNAVRQFEEQSTRTGQQSLLKDAIKYADELGIILNLEARMWFRMNFTSGVFSVKHSCLHNNCRQDQTCRKR